MGKRELLIVAGFVAAGLLAYQFAVPSTTTRPVRFTLSALVESFRRDGGGRRATATVTTRGTIALDAAMTEARISAVSRLTVTGTTRTDIAYELTVESAGTDEARAREVAAGTTLGQDRVGSVLALRTSTPSGQRSMTQLSLEVPARLVIRVEGLASGGRVTLGDVAGLRLDSTAVDVTASRIAGTVGGTHRNADLTITDAGGVDLTLVGSRAALEAVRGSVAVAARNGRLRVVAPRGPVELDLTNEETVVDAPRRTVGVVGTNGQIAIGDPADAVTLDVRRMAVEVRLTRAVPVSALTADARLVLRLVGPPPVMLDAVATAGGRIQSADFGLSPDVIGNEVRLRHVFGAGAATVALRSARSEIVIARAK